MRLIHYGLMWAVVFLGASCSGQTNPTADLAENETSPSSTEVVVPDQSIAFDDTIATPPVQPLPNEVPPLFAPTPPEQRAAQVAAGRPDPFSSVSASPTLVPARTVRPQPQQSLPLQPLQPIPLASLPNLPPPPISTIPIPVQSQPPGVVPIQPTAPSASPQPTPVAIPAIQSIQVSGVVDVGGVARAIVTVPNEGSGRSVSVGDRIANGQVLVKRIDIRPGGDPIVVLEQNGVEVTRYVSLSGS